MTKTYEGTAIYDACKGYRVKADNLDEAIELLEANADSPSLCHQCAGEVGLGDLVGLIVYCDGKEVADTRYEAEKLAQVSARLAGVEALLPAALFGSEQEAAKALNALRALYQEPPK